jgi:hypothetical protein
VGLITNCLSGCDYELEFQVKELAIQKYQSELITHVCDYVRKSYNPTWECVSRFGFVWKRKTVFKTKVGLSLGCQNIAASLLWRDHSGVWQF